MIGKTSQETDALEAGEATNTLMPSSPAGSVVEGELLHLLLESDVNGSLEPILGIVTGRVLYAGKGSPLVSFPGSSLDGVEARAIVDVSESDIGCEVALMFEGGNPSRPIIMGIVRTFAPVVSSAEAPKLPVIDSPSISKGQIPLSISVDGDAVVFAAEREIVLRCGKASISLTRDGHVVLRGEYILSRAVGVNRIKGGSVQIN